MGKQDFKTTLATIACVFQSLKIYIIISLVLMWIRSPVFYSRARLRQWFDSCSVLFIKILHHRRSCPALLLVQINMAEEMPEPSLPLNVVTGT